MLPLSLPYAHLNLCRNPFGELTPAERVQVAVVDLTPWLSQLADPTFALQVLGEKGRGKTTHLLALHACCPDASYRHIDEGERVTVRQIPPGNPTFVDECQRLSAWNRRKLFRRPHALVIGSHQDHRVQLERAGRRVETLRPADRICPEAVLAMLQARVEMARRAPGPIPTLGLSTARRLTSLFGTDVRAMEHHLYEIFQRLEVICDVEV